MSFPFNFAQSDEQFIAKVRTSKDRDMTIARLEVFRAWCFWLMWFGIVSSTIAFILGCFVTPFTLSKFSSSALQALITQLAFLLLFAVTDTQIKTLKLAQRYEQEETP